MVNPKKPRSSCENCGTECSRPRQKYCSNKCQQENRHKRYIERWLREEVSGNKGVKETTLSRRVRSYMLKEANYTCDICGWNEINPSTGLIPLHVDHLDGDHKNSRRDNLQVKCPNCHSLTENYGALNKGMGRRVRP